MNSNIKISLLMLFVMLMKMQAQDVVVKINNSRINTTVTKVTDSLILCKNYNQIIDTTFSISTKELKMIIYQIGNIQYFNDEKTKLEKSTYITPNHAANPYDSDSFQATISTIENGGFAFDYQGSIEIGAGFTSSFLNSAYAAKYTPYQLNFRALIKRNKTSKTLIGLNANYTNLALIAVAKRYSGAFVIQHILGSNSKNIFYLNFMAGVNYFDGYQTSGFNYFSDSYLPMVHIGFGGKYFFLNKTSGIFYETGLGGPYFVNVGLFFY